MRLWSIHPKYLDTKGLIALWRETLLAKAVLMNQTKGYTNHPQLNRFKQSENTILFINTYLSFILEEAQKRKYNFNSKKIDFTKITDKKINVNEGQIKYEFQHLSNKLKIRDIIKYKEMQNTKQIEIHPIFQLVKNNDIEEWEKTK